MVAAEDPELIDTSNRQLHMKRLSQKKKKHTQKTGRMTPTHQANEKKQTKTHQSG